MWTNWTSWKSLKKCPCFFTAHSEMQRTFWKGRTLIFYWLMMQWESGWCSTLGIWNWSSLFAHLCLREKVKKEEKSVSILRWINSLPIFPVTLPSLSFFGSPVSSVSFSFWKNKFSSFPRSNWSQKDRMNLCHSNIYTPMNPENLLSTSDFCEKLIIDVNIIYLPNICIRNWCNQSASLINSSSFEKHFYSSIL